MKFQVCHEHCKHSCWSLSQCHPAGQDSETGNGIHRETVYWLCTNMVIAVSSPTNLLQILLDSFFFFACGLFMACLAGSKAVEKKCRRVTQFHDFVSSRTQNFNALNGFPRTSGDPNTLRTVSPGSCGEFVTMTTSHLSLTHYTGPHFRAHPWQYSYSAQRTCDHTL